MSTCPSESVGMVQGQPKYASRMLRTVVCSRGRASGCGTGPETAGFEAHIAQSHNGWERTCPLVSMGESCSLSGQLTWEHANTHVCEACSRCAFICARYGTYDLGSA
ncbi:hypothetical protein BCR44DRAFT_36754 [Catenaria anguillulae PL171]|uniref:Uncharacterized protein n=1 Tax=Catenaria anguillulae PL171 TaxID=765915 RepID=A0A1Y2H527_9FUNG|nr:hypothetical protein BCR44DRAFT_36754 [Catenaria anguillulae PL171]